MLGDSYAEALQVPIEETFWTLLPQHLARCGFAPGKQIEAINFGVSGYGTAQELLTLRHRAWDYAPDLVLVPFFPGNDVRNNSKALEPDKLRPFLGCLREALQLETPPRRQVFQAYKRRGVVSRTAGAGRTSSRTSAREDFACATTSPSRRARGGPAGRSGANRAGSRNVLREPEIPGRGRAWMITQKLTLRCMEKARRGARFL